MPNLVISTPGDLGCLANVKLANIYHAMFHPSLICCSPTLYSTVELFADIMCNILKLFGKQGFYSKNIFPSATQCYLIQKCEGP